MTAICGSASTPRCAYFGCHLFDKLCKDGFEEVREWPREDGVDDLYEDVDVLLVPVNYTDTHWALPLSISGRAPSATSTRCCPRTRTP
jgi:Ulp1 family protease